MFEKWRYFRKARNVTLTSAEKAGGREVLARFMETHPVREEKLARHRERRDTFTPSPFALVNAKPMPIILALLIALSGGTALAAESALPNSALYPVKIHMNENARRSLALSAEAKTDVEVGLTVRRLQEGEALIDRTTFDANAWATLEAGFTRNLEASREHIRTLEARGDHEAAVAASARLASELTAHAAILAALEAGTDVLEGGNASSSQDISGDLDVNTDARVRVIAPERADVDVQEAVKVRALLDLVETAQLELSEEAAVQGSVNEEPAPSPSQTPEDPDRGTAPSESGDAEVRVRTDAQVEVPVRVEIRQGAGLELGL